MNDEEFFGYHDSRHNEDIAEHIENTLRVLAPELLLTYRYVEDTRKGLPLAYVMRCVLHRRDAAVLIRRLSNGRKMSAFETQRMLCEAVDKESPLDACDVLVEMGATWYDAVQYCRNIEQMRRAASLGQDVNRSRHIERMCSRRDDFIELRSLGVDFEGPTGFIVRTALKSFYAGVVAIPTFACRRVYDIEGRGLQYLYRRAHGYPSPCLSDLGFQDQTEKQRLQAFAAIRVLVLCSGDGWPCHTLIPLSGIGQGRDGDNPIKRTIRDFIYEFKLLEL